MTDGSGLLNTLNKIVSENNDFKVLEIYNLAAQSHVKLVLLKYPNILLT